MERKASSANMGKKAASASAAQKIAGADASNKAGAAGAEKKTAQPSYLPLIAVAIAVVAILAVFFMGVVQSSLPAPIRAVNLSSLDELCPYLKGSIAAAGKCPNDTLSAPAPAFAGKNKVCCYLPLARNEILRVSISREQAAAYEFHNPAASCGAGYVWCNEQLKCIDSALENCTDLHGCTKDTGYFWCEEAQKCIDPAVENCTDSHGCITSADYEWCGILQKCLPVYGGNCAPTPGVFRNQSGALDDTTPRS